jgi:hypothetical protein
MKKSTLTTAAFALLIGATSAHAGVYKCITDGRVTYSDQPCGAQTEVVRIQEAPAKTTRHDDREWKNSTLLKQADERAAREAAKRSAIYAERARYVEDRKRRQELEDAARQKNILVGMDHALVIRSWGEPSRIKEGIDTRGGWEQWIYEVNRNERRYVQFRNGIVTSAR